VSKSTPKSGRKSKLTRAEYVVERAELYKYQQACYDGFERTITALVASTLGFSVAFVGYLSRTSSLSTVSSSMQIPRTLLWSRFALGMSLVSLLLLFFTNARSYTVEITKVEDAMEDDIALERVNWWPRVSWLLYLISFVGFVIGLILLLYFSWYNLPH
jgi:hypothetical protein